MNFILTNGPLLTRCSGAIRWLSSSRNQITMANSAAAPGRRFSPAYRSRPIAAPAVLADGRPTCDVTPRARSACIISSLHQHVFSDAPPCVSDWLIRIAVCLRRKDVHESGLREGNADVGSASRSQRTFKARAKNWTSLQGSAPSSAARVL